MTRKSIVALVLVLMLAMVGCSQSSPQSSNSSETPTSGSSNNSSRDNVTLKIFNSKTEIVEQLSKLKKDYENEHPGVTLQIDTVDGTHYQSNLKGRFAGNEMPDIFLNQGHQEMETWIDHMEDLSDQPWVKDVVDIARDPITKDGNLYGMPMTIEGYGFIYNIELFEKAGIKETPKTLSELKAVIQQLEDAGIKPFASSYLAWAIPGRFGVNIPFAMQPDPVQFINGLNQGNAQIPGNKLFEEWMNLVDLELQHSGTNPMTTDYNTQVTVFANGGAAMIHNGSWIQPTLTKLNSNMKVGILPMPINNDPQLNDKIFVGVPYFWVVNKNSNVKQEAKEFLNWLVTSETGKRYVTEELKFVPAFKNVEGNPEAIGDLGTAVQTYANEGKTYGWHWPQYPIGTPQEFGAIMQKYSAGGLKREQLLNELNEGWRKYKQ
ncbi:ABC transporter substrate-binding protein [Ammoniphilus sp. YIM 78166]|uniref:ABC transporter substrate-binding protein n=1 Tax=Ammoniphilus sp. YIM 78166 TaxID=1644106 RepID=UPI00106F37E3|nr:ABC transporter substrate-binding protein [Ammoniphilus sp. YIM 78166]